MFSVSPLSKSEVINLATNFILQRQSQINKLQQLIAQVKQSNSSIFELETLLTSPEYWRIFRGHLPYTQKVMEIAEFEDFENQIL